MARIKVRFRSGRTEKEAEYSFDYFLNAFRDEVQCVREAFERDWMTRHRADDLEYRCDDPDESEELYLTAVNDAADAALNEHHIEETWADFAPLAIDASKYVKILAVYDILKTCPFCGGFAEITRDKSGNYLVQCTGEECHVQTPAGLTKDIAIEIWNNRSRENRE